MFQTNVSPLQLHKLRALPSGMTESDHLSQAYLTEPEKMDSVLAYAFGTQNETVLSMLTGGIGNTRFVSNREYTWDLHLIGIGRAIRILWHCRCCHGLLFRCCARGCMGNIGMQPDPSR